jgi:hypothetical protein
MVHFRKIRNFIPKIIFYIVIINGYARSNNPIKFVNIDSYS